MLFGDFSFLQTLMNANSLRAILWRHVQTQRDRIYVNVKVATQETEKWIVLVTICEIFHPKTPHKRGLPPTNTKEN